MDENDRTFFERMFNVLAAKLIANSIERADEAWARLREVAATPPASEARPRCPTCGQVVPSVDETHGR